MVSSQIYKPKEFQLSSLRGISDQTLEVHFKLYQGYVNETNRLNDKIAGLIREGRLDPEMMPAYSELKRRLGFEYNGMVLHEYYFGNLKREGGGDPGRDSRFRGAVEAGFGSYDLWKLDFTSVGRMRGVGWAITYQDPASGGVSNHWVNLHETGNIAGFRPLLVMDVWEHAFLLDYKPAERPKYIEAFFSNIDWSAVDKRVLGT